MKPRNQWLFEAPLILGRDCSTTPELEMEWETQPTVFQSNRFRGDRRLQAAANNSPPLRAGERGEAVRKLQQALIDLRFPMPISTSRGTPDGSYGSETVTTVKKFQAKYGLGIDGMAGQQTLSRLDQLFFRPSYPPVPPGSGTLPKPPTSQPPSHTKSCNLFQAEFERAATKAGVPISWAQNLSLCELVKHESNWNSAAKNPNSSAFGLFQFITKTWTTYLPEVPYGNTDPTWQAVGGFRYIKDVYRAPERAWAFWQATIQKNPSLAPPDLQAKVKEWIAKGWGGY
jgi:hypothetical protein